MPKPPVSKNDIVTLIITDITGDGNGIGHADSFAVFVPFTAIGDVIKAKILKVKSSFAYGKIEEIVTPSPGRTENHCPVFFQCGGCSLRHIKYSSELSVKEKIVRDNILKFSDASPIFENIIPSPDTERYRNKAVYPVGLDDNGNAVMGFYAKRSHRIIPIGDCLLQPSEFSDIASYTLAVCTEHGIRAYDEKKHVGMLRHIFLRRDEHSGDCMLCLIINSDKLPQLGEITDKIILKFPCVKTIVVNHNTLKTNVILGKNNTVIHGSGVISCKLCSLDFEVAPLSFFQVNLKSTEFLYKKAAEYANLEDGDTLLDLYCGTGTVGLSMVSDKNSLVGVEVVPEAVENAKINALKNNIPNTKFISADVETASVELANEGLAVDAVVLDPPRSGCDMKTIESVCKMSPSRIVYISCNSATLARDIERFSQFSYTAKKVCPVDMFPRTPHVECVCLMTRAEE